MSALRTILLLPFALASAAFAQEQPPQPDKTIEQQQIAEALKLTTEAARELSLTIPGEKEHSLTLEPKSLLQWSNPAAGTIYGNVFLWTYDKRPQAIASIYKWYSPYKQAEFEIHSLSTGPLRGRRKGNDLWNTQTPGLEWKPLPGRVSVAETPALRLIQLRRIARDFSVEKTDREHLTREMRLLPQPLYRYTSKSQNVIDGALFVFVQGTDPEVFLLVEAIPSDKDASRAWQYALVRMNSVTFVATFKQTEVWRVETLLWSQVKQPANPYFSGPVK